MTHPCFLGVFIPCLLSSYAQAGVLRGTVLVASDVDRHSRQIRFGVTPLPALSAVAPSLDADLPYRVATVREQSLIQHTLQAATSEVDLKLLAELRKMHLGALKKKALEIGCNKSAVGNADDSEDPKQAVIQFILAKTKAATIEVDPKLLAELKMMHLGTLKKKAREIGCDKSAVVDADDSEDPKQAVIKLILAKTKVSRGKQPLPSTSAASVMGLGVQTDENMIDLPASPTDSSKEANLPIKSVLPELPAHDPTDVDEGKSSLDVQVKRGDVEVVSGCDDATVDCDTAVDQDIPAAVVSGCDDATTDCEPDDDAGNAADSELEIVSGCDDATPDCETAIAT